MVKSFDKTENIKIWEELGNDVYRVRWNVTPLKNKDEDGNETDSGLSSYTLEQYNYKPNINIIVNDILKGDDKAALSEVKEICTNLDVDPIAPCKQLLLQYITDYDSSSNVNSFTLGGQEVWLDKDTRVGLMNSTTITKNLGNDTTTLWLGTTKLEIPCDTAIALLSSLEMYALECYNTTAAHKKAVEAMTTIDELISYDYTAGYPEKLNMSV